jgi:hypothetical protein
VLTAALRQIPFRMRSKLLVRVDGVGASHELIAHLLSLASRRRTVLFTSGWMITAADEEAIGLLPAAWQAAMDQEGLVQEDKHVAEITHLLSRAGRWPAGLRWVVRRTRPSRRQAKNLTAFERATGWRYSIICTNIPAARDPRRAWQPPRPVHRRAGPPARRGRGRRPRRQIHGPAEPSIETLVVNCGWVLAANLAAWCRLLGLYDQEDLKDAEPDTLRYRLLSLPARLVRHARARVLKISRTW